MILISFINFILNIFKRCNYTVWAKWVICHHSLLPIPSAWPSTASAAAAPCAAPARLWRSPSRCLAFLRRRRPFSPAPGLSLSFPSLHPHLATAPPLSPAAASTPGHCPHSFSTIAAHSQHSGRHSTSSATSPRAVTATPSDHQPHRTAPWQPLHSPFRDSKMGEFIFSLIWIVTVCEIGPVCGLWFGLLSESGEILCIIWDSFGKLLRATLLEAQLYIYIFIFFYFFLIGRNHLS